MLNKATMNQLRFELGVDHLVETMYKTADRVAATRRNLSELNRRVRDKEMVVEDLELPILAEASQNGKNETERKANFKRLCKEDANWQRVSADHADARHHRDLVNAELEGLIDRLSAQRHASDLIAATLNASVE